MFVILMGLLGSLGALLPAGLVLFIPDGWRQWNRRNLSRRRGCFDGEIGTTPHEEKQGHAD